MQQLLALRIVVIRGASQVGLFFTVGYDVLVPLMGPEAANSGFVAASPGGSAHRAPNGPRSSAAIDQLSRDIIFRVQISRSVESVLDVY